MKRVLIAGVILLLSAGPAGAVGLNLSWNNCHGSSGAAQDQAFSCDDSAPGAMDANTGQFLLFGSVIAGFDLAGLLSWTAVVDVQTASATLDDWWKLGTSECREAGFNVLINGFANVTTCNKTMMQGSPAPIVVSNWNSDGTTLNPPHGTNWARLGATAARTAGFNVVGAVHYQVFEVLVDTHNTKVNGDGTTVACAGCLDPACLVFNSFEMDIPPSGSDNGKNFVTSEDSQRWVTWQGGSIGGGGCPASVPVHRTSWGQVKSLYR